MMGVLGGVVVVAASKLGVRSLRKAEKAGKFSAAAECR
jgi:hypothetical protein